LDVESAMAASMVAVSGVDPTAPIDVHVGQKNGNSASLALPSANVSGDDGTAVWFAAQVSGGSSCPAIHTPPAGFTEHVDTCLISSSQGVLHSIASAQLGEAGAHPGFTGSSTLANTNITHAVVLRAEATSVPEPAITLVGATHASGKSSTAITLATPAGAVPGAVLLAPLANRNHIEAELSPPAGWTPVRSDMSSWTIRGWIFVRV